MSTTSTALMTAEELMQLPDSPFRHELINGELIEMPLPGLLHGRIVTRIGVLLGPFVWDHKLGEVYSRAGYQLTWNPDTVLGPDISFISKVRLEGTKETEGYWQGPPDLAIELLDPGDGSDEIHQKTSRWLRFGAKQVWIVDPDQSTITVCRSESDTATFSGSDYLEAQDLLPGFRVSLDGIFAP